MKKLILLILIASLLTSCGAKPSGTPDDIPGTDDTSSIEITETEETEPETTTEPATTTEETTEEVTETTIPETTAEETTAEPVFDPENLMGGTLLCKGKECNLVQFDDHISIIDADGEHETDLPMEEYIWFAEDRGGFQAFSKSHVMYTVYYQPMYSDNYEFIGNKIESHELRIDDIGEFNEYTYYSIERPSGYSVLVDKDDNVIMSTTEGYTVSNGWLIEGGHAEYHWSAAYSENLTKVTSDDWDCRLGPLEDGRIVVGDKTSFSIKKQPDGATEAKYDGFDEVYYITYDKVFVQKDGHILLMNINGTPDVDFGEFDPGENAYPVYFQTGYGTETAYIRSDEKNENGDYDYQEITFDGKYYYITFENVKTPDMSPDSHGTSVEFYYIPDTGDSGRLDNVEIGAIEKPVLYLYPTAPTEVTVTFAHPELLTTVYPEYRDGWRMFVQNNGTMTEIGKTREYYALYWEERPTEPYEFTEGFYVDKNYPEFLEEKLSELGLTDREANEFIMYWLPVLEKNGRNLVAFETTESREYANKLQITPMPDSLLRISIHIKKVDSDPGLPEQKLPCFLRKGFTAVEWGGQVHT